MLLRTLTLIIALTTWDKAAHASVGDDADISRHRAIAPGQVEGGNIPTGRHLRMRRASDFGLPNETILEFSHRMRELSKRKHMERVFGLPVGSLSMPLTASSILLHQRQNSMRPSGHHHYPPGYQLISSTSSPYPHRGQ